MALSLLPTPLRVNGPISDMDRIENLRSALERIAKNAGHGYGGYYAVTAAEIALADDDKLAAAQDEAIMAERDEDARRAIEFLAEGRTCSLCNKPTLVGDHLTCMRRENALVEAEGLPW